MAVHTEFGMLSSAKLADVGSIVLVGPPLSARPLTSVPDNPVRSPGATEKIPQPGPAAAGRVASVGSVLML